MIREVNAHPSCRTAENGSRGRGESHPPPPHFWLVKRNTGIAPCIPRREHCVWVTQGDSDIRTSSRRCSSEIGTQRPLAGGTVHWHLRFPSLRETLIRVKGFALSNSKLRTHPQGKVKVSVLNWAPFHEDIWGRWRYSSMNSYLWWVVSLTDQPLDRRLGALRSRFKRGGEDKIILLLPLTWNRPPFIRPVA
jgi:hypothetical protein